MITSTLSITSANFDPRTGEMTCRCDPTSPLYIYELVIEVHANLGAPVGLLRPGTVQRPVLRTIFVDSAEPVFAVAAPFTLAVTYDASFHLTAIQVMSPTLDLVTVAAEGFAERVLETVARFRDSPPLAPRPAPAAPPPSAFAPGSLAPGFSPGPAAPAGGTPPPNAPAPRASPAPTPFPTKASPFGATLAAPGPFPASARPVALTVESASTAQPSKPSLPSVPPSAALAAGGNAVGCGGQDAVDCSLFCPPTPTRGDRFLVQVFGHRPEQHAEVRAEAKEVDGSAVRRGHKRLLLPVALGTVLQIELRAPSLQIERAAEELVWTGQPEAVQFVLTVPLDHPAGKVILSLTIGMNDIPLGKISGTIEVMTEATEDGSSRKPSALGDEAVRYETAFMSYASADRAEVLKRVQAVRAAGLKCFQDVIDLEPGERWQQALYRHIDECDLFLLFWSTHAKDSEWVMKEARYALARQGGQVSAPPAIRPVVLENPPALPPPDLAHLHFNDLFAQLINVEPASPGKATER